MRNIFYILKTIYAIKGTLLRENSIRKSSNFGIFIFVQRSKIKASYLFLLNNSNVDLKITLSDFKT